MTTTATKTCPSCSASLVELERSGIHIDACPRCRGVWLDRGELDRLIEYEGSSQEPDVDEDFIAEMQGRSKGGVTAPRSDDEDEGRVPFFGQRKGGRRRGSFLEELFDFGG